MLASHPAEGVRYHGRGCYSFICGLKAEWCSDLIANPPILRPETAQILKRAAGSRARPLACCDLLSYRLCPTGPHCVPVRR